MLEGFKMVVKTGMQQAPNAHVIHSSKQFLLYSDFGWPQERLGPQIYTQHREEKLALRFLTGGSSVKDYGLAYWRVFIKR